MNQQLKKYLTFSVILNLLFAGFLLGGFSYKMMASTPGDNSQALASLPEEQRRQMETALSPLWKSMQEAHIEIEKEKEKTTALLKAEPFDPDAYIEQIHHLSQLRAKQKFDMAKSVVTIAKQFPPQQRAVLADIISRPPAYLACPSDNKNSN